MSEPPRPPPKSITTNGTTTAATTKSKLKHPYRPYPPPNNRRRRQQAKACRSCFRRCFCWTILVILGLCLLLLATMAALYLLYNPRRPIFSVASLSTSKLKLPSTDQLSTTFFLTVLSRNPNSHSITFLYDPVTVSLSSENSDNFLGNGTIPEFSSDPKDRTSLKATVSVDSLLLDDDSVNSLRTELKDASGINAKVIMDTKVRMKAGILKSNKVPVRVTCDGIKGVVAPAKKANSSPTSATIGKSECKVDLRIKIWKFTF